jgi:hypothetical protein
VEVVVGRLQDRDTPVPIDPNAAREPDEETQKQLESTPDAPGTARKRRRSRAPAS